MTAADRKQMILAIRVARTSRNEPGMKPFVGAVAVKRGAVIGTAARGEIEGMHAEHALMKKLDNRDLTNATIFTTLEPCTLRNQPQTPCADLLVERRVKRVVIGILDPHIVICGQGYQRLRDAGIKVELFLPDLAMKVEEMNRDFRTEHRRRVLIGEKLDTMSEAVVGDHFYTTDLKEFRLAVNHLQYRFETIACYVHPATNTPSKELVPFYRVWNYSRWDHFYTTDLSERDQAMAKYEYVSEPTSCMVWPSKGLNTTPLRRFFHQQRYDHFYTIHDEEADAALRLGYSEEAPACHVLGTQMPGSVPFFRAVSLQ